MSPTPAWLDLILVLKCLWCHQAAPPKTFTILEENDGWETIQEAQHAAATFALYNVSLSFQAYLSHLLTANIISDERPMSIAAINYHMQCRGIGVLLHAPHRRFPVHPVLWCWDMHAASTQIDAYATWAGVARG